MVKLSFLSIFLRNRNHFIHLDTTAKKSRFYLTIFLCPGVPGGVRPVLNEEHFFNLGVTSVSDTGVFCSLAAVWSLAGAECLRMGVMSSPISSWLKLLPAEFTWWRPIKKLVNLTSNFSAWQIHNYFLFSLLYNINPRSLNFAIKCKD